MGDELVQLDRLEKQVAALRLEGEDTALLAQKVLSVFDDLFLQKLQEKDSRTLAILSRYIAEVIERSAQTHLPELSHALQQVISPAIARGIRENKEKMVDALYPVIGSLVSKYVSQSFKELLDRINSRIERGLTPGHYKRKLKSKVTGVSETELIMEESVKAAVSSLLVIHKESGLLIAEAHKADRAIGDVHMVASMASAIKDFVNDWIRKHSKTVSEVEILSYGNATLYIESAGSVYLVAFLDAEPDAQQRMRINRFFARLIEKYQHFFQQFDGDDSVPKIAEVSNTLTHFLEKEAKRFQGEAESPLQQRGIKILSVVLVILMFGYGYRFARHQYRAYYLEHLVAQKTGQHIVLDDDGDRVYLRGNVDSLRAHRAVMKLIKRELDVPVTDALHLPLGVTDQLFSDLQQKLKDHIPGDIRALREQLQALRVEADTQLASISAAMVRQEGNRRPENQQGIDPHDRNLSQLMLHMARALKALKNLEIRVQSLEALSDSNRAGTLLSPTTKGSQGKSEYNLESIRRKNQTIHKEAQ